MHKAYAIKRDHQEIRGDKRRRQNNLLKLEKFSKARFYLPLFAPKLKIIKTSILIMMKCFT